MPFADANGQRLFYVEQGAGDPLLLVTGLGGDHLSWGEQLGPFSERFRTIGFDNRDSGRSSEAPEAYEIADMARDTLGLADHLELDDFHLLGISMGGAIAQELSLAAPERVRTLTLAMSWPGDGHWGRVRGRLMANAAIRTPREEHIEQLLLACLSEETFEDPERVASFRTMVLDSPHPQSVEAFARQAQAVGGHEARDRLGALDVPTHVIGAERDLMIPVWKARELAELIPGSRLTVLERGTHAANLEQADEFNRVVLEFLDGARGVGRRGADQRDSASVRTTAS